MSIPPVIFLTIQSFPYINFNPNPEIVNQSLAPAQGNNLSAVAEMLLCVIILSMLKKL